MSRVGWVRPATIAWHQICQSSEHEMADQMLVEDMPVWQAAQTRKEQGGL